MRSITLVAFLAGVLLAAHSFIFGQSPSAKSPVTEISADLGPCTAEFHIADMEGAPLYNVKIRTTIRYGFLGKRKLELETATNADGRARFVNLPAEAKKPIEFQVTNGTDSALRTFDPASDCTARYDIPLKSK